MNKDKKYSISPNLLLDFETLPMTMTAGIGTVRSQMKTIPEMMNFRFPAKPREDAQEQIWNEGKAFGTF